MRKNLSMTWPLILHLNRLYQKALADKEMYDQKMIGISDSLWQKYYGNQARPAESMQRVQMVIDKIQLQHASAKIFLTHLTTRCTG